VLGDVVEYLRTGLTRSQRADLIHRFQAMQRGLASLRSQLAQVRQALASGVAVTGAQRQAIDRLANVVREGDDLEAAIAPALQEALADATRRGLILGDPGIVGLGVLPIVAIGIAAALILATGLIAGGIYKYLSRLSDVVSKEAGEGAAARAEVLAQWRAMQAASPGALIPLPADALPVSPLATVAAGAASALGLGTLALIGLGAWMMLRGKARGGRR